MAMTKEALKKLITPILTNTSLTIQEKQEQFIPYMLELQTQFDDPDEMFEFWNSCIVEIHQEHILGRH